MYRKLLLGLEIKLVLCRVWPHPSKQSNYYTWKKRITMHGLYISNKYLVKLLKCKHWKKHRDNFSIRKRNKQHISKTSTCIHVYYLFSTAIFFILNNWLHNSPPFSETLSTLYILQFLHRNAPPLYFQSCLSGIICGGTLHYIYLK